VALAAASLLASSPDAASGDIENLGTLPGGTSRQGYAVNAPGQVAGYSFAMNRSTCALAWAREVNSSRPYLSLCGCLGPGTIVISFAREFSGGFPAPSSAW